MSACSSCECQTNALCLVHKPIRDWQKGVTMNCAQCERKVYSVGLCTAHYMAYYRAKKKYGIPTKVPKRHGGCVEVGCEREIYSNSICAAHYMRVYRRRLKIRNNEGLKI
jgi:hypothetical protein